MRKAPKMIMFDFGHTLCDEPEYDRPAAFAAIEKHIVKNPLRYTKEDIQKAVMDMIHPAMLSLHKVLLDFRATDVYRIMTDYLQIELDIDPYEAETVAWDAVSYGSQMPGADDMLAFLEKKGIRYAVISNYFWSGRAIETRLKSALPDRKFEFVMASSDYLFRKPSTNLFKIGLAKAGLPAEDVWYCGDKMLPDVIGSSSAGIFPVLYKKNKRPNYNAMFDLPAGQKPDCDYMEIEEWSELTNYLETLEN